MNKDQPLEMSAYEWMFSTCRIPHIKEDYLEKHPNSKHVSIMRHNKIYTFDVYDSNGSALTVDQIESQLNKVIDLSNGDKNLETPIGVLTADDRTFWAKVWRRYTEIDSRHVTSFYLKTKLHYNV